MTVVHGSAQPPSVMEYRVGPIHGCDVNACDDAYVEPGSPLTPLVTPGTIPFEKRPMDMGDATPFAVAGGVLGPLQSLLIESFGAVWDETLMPGCGSECFSGSAGKLFPFPFNDIESTSQERVSKIQFFWYLDPSNVQAIWLHGLPLSFRVAQKGTDPAGWRVYDLFYCGQVRGPSSSFRVLPRPSNSFRVLPSPSNSFRVLPIPSESFRVLPSPSNSF